MQNIKEQFIMGKFQVIDHPLIQHKLTIIRDKNCGTKVFREVVNEISMRMTYDVSRDLPLEDVEIEETDEGDDAQYEPDVHHLPDQGGETGCDGDVLRQRDVERSSRESDGARERLHHR